MPAERKGGPIGFWGWVSIIFFGVVLLVHAINGARYVFDDEYRSKRIAEKARKEREALIQKAQENRLRWIINGCNVPGTCNEIGQRLDGDLSGELLIREMERRR